MTEPASHQPTALELDVLGERVFCDDELALGWTTVVALPGEAAMRRMNERNEVVLRTLALVEEHDETQSEDAERAEFHRLEAKLDLALELLADLIGSRQGTVAVRAVRFNSHGFCWQSEEPLPRDTLLRIECYVLPAWPVTLRLHARVASSESQGGGFRVCCRLVGLSAGAGNWLEKLVFRRHRRAIAHSRASGTQGNSPAV